MEVRKLGYVYQVDLAKLALEAGREVDRGFGCEKWGSAAYLSYFFHMYGHKKINTFYAASVISTLLDEEIPSTRRKKGLDSREQALFVASYLRNYRKLSRGDQERLRGICYLTSGVAERMKDFNGETVFEKIISGEAVLVG